MVTSWHRREMPPSARKSIKERTLFSLTSSLPCGSRLKGVLCSHLKSLWMVLMALTVLCVAIQILGVVWQSRNSKMLSEKVLNLRFTIDIQRTPPVEHWDWERLRSLPSPVVDEDVKPQEQSVSKRQRLAEYQPGREEPGQEWKVTELSNPFSTVKDPRKQAWDKVLALKAALSKVTLGNNVLHLGVPWSVALRPEGALGHPASRGPPTLPGNPLQHYSTHRPKSRNSPALPGTALPHARSAYGNDVESLVAGPPINTAGPGDATSTCQRKNHIVFLKTHKTASSTILNILYRYGDSRNLTFALPLSKHSQLFYPYFFSSHFVEGMKSGSVKEFHIMCNHMRFRRAEVVKVMPQDTFYFSILRNPVAMMESIFIYYKSIPAFNKIKSLDDFFDNGSRTFNTSLSNNHYARNILTFDFGFDNNVAVETTEDLEMRVAMTISAIEQDFNLILISEYFDESMILLKHALCWSLDDVVSFKLNSRSERTRHTLSPQTADKIRAWNALDWKLYLHFNATFWRRVDITVGSEKMRQEVNELQERRAELAKTCLQDGGAVDPSQVKDVGLKPFQYGAAVIQGYNLNPGLDGPAKTLCQNLITPELQYTDILYTKQFPDLVAKQRDAAKLAASQLKPGSAKVSQNRVREARHARTARSRLRSIRNQNALVLSAQSKHTAPRSKRNMP